MTRKDCKLIAEVLRTSRPYERDAVFYSGWEQAVDALADALSFDNVRFDRERFLEVCKS